MTIKSLAIATVLTLVATSSIAATITPVTFPKGSSCGSFEGKYEGRRFTLPLMANQTLTVSVDSSVADIIIKPPKGRAEHMAEDDTYLTRSRGKYSITIVPDQTAYGEVKFCAY